MDTNELAAAYQAVLDLATQAAGPAEAAGRPERPGSGGSPEAAGGDAWRPGDVLAHLIVNDRLLCRVVRSVLEGAAQPYDNADAVELAELRALGDDLGGTAGLADGLRASSRELLELAGRLDEAQAATPLPARILDGDVLRLDRPVPVAALLATQARVHLPSHRRQLAELLELP